MYLTNKTMSTWFDSYTGGRTATEGEALRGGHLNGQGGAHGALLLQGKGRNMLVILRGGDRRLVGGDCRN